MKTQSLHRYLTKRLKSVEEHLSAYQKEKDPVYLHLLRVEIKSIKAVFSFLEIPNKENNSIADLKSLFREAGTIRELQLTNQLFYSLPLFPEKNLLSLQQKELKLKDKFEANIPRYLTLVKAFRKGLSLEHAFPDKKIIKHYFMSKVNELFIEPDIEDRKDMHHFRKEIKELVYVYKALPKKLKESFKLNKSYLNKLQEKAGRWHDTYVALDLLSHQKPSKNISACITLLKAKESKQFNDLIDFRSKEIQVMK